MKNRYLYLAAGTLILLFVGLLYAWSVFIAPLEMVNGWERIQTAHIFTVSMTAFCAGGILGGYIIRRKSASFIIRCSAVIMSLGFLFCAYTTSLFGIYIAYGVFCSIGVGLTYNAVLSTVIKWFPDKPALCSGILLMGFGAGGFLLGNIAQFIIGEPSRQNVGNAFIIFAIMCAVILTLSSFLVFAPKDDAGKLTKDSSAQQANDFQTKDMLRKPVFWIIFLWGFFASASALSVIGQGSPMAKGLGMDAQLAAFAVGIISVFNGLGRVFIGYFYSKVDRKTLMTGISSTFILGAATLLIAFQTNNSILIYPGFLLIGFGFGSIPSFGVSIIREFYGSKYYSVNMSIFNIHLILSVLLGSTVGGIIMQTTKDYMYVIALTLVAGIASILFSFSMRKNPN